MSMHFAAEHGDIVALADLMSKGTHVDIIDSYSKTPLHIAAGNGFGECSLFLLNRGADVNARSSSYSTPLHYALQFTEQRYEHCARILIEHGADLNAVDIDGWTSMHSVIHGPYDMLPFLIERGADLNARTFSGKTPLMYAVMRGLRSCVLDLLNCHADTEIEDFKCRKAINYCPIDREDIRELLLGGGASTKSAN